MFAIITRYPSKAQFFIAAKKGSRTCQLSEAHIWKTKAGAERYVNRMVAEWGWNSNLVQLVVVDCATVDAVLKRPC